MLTFYLCFFNFLHSILFCPLAGWAIKSLRVQPNVISFHGITIRQYYSFFFGIWRNSISSSCKWLEKEKKMPQNIFEVYCYFRIFKWKMDQFQVILVKVRCLPCIFTSLDLDPEHICGHPIWDQLGRDMLIRHKDLSTGPFCAYLPFQYCSEFT